MKKKINNNYNEGIALLKEEDYYQAHERFESVISIDPEHKGARRFILFTKEAKEKNAKKHYEMGLSKKREGRYEEALDQFLIVFKKNPRYKDINYQIENLRNSRPIQKKFNKALNNANLLYNKKLYKKAYKKCLTAKKFNPESLELLTINIKVEAALNDLSKSHFQKAKNMFDKKNYRAARTYLIKVFKINPWHSRAKELLSDCNRKIDLGKLYKRAENKFYKNEYFQAFNLFSEINRKEKGYLDTDIYLSRIKKKVSKNFREYYNKGIWYYDRGRYKEAIAQWNKILLINPDEKKAREYKEIAFAELEIKKIRGEN